MTLFSTSFYHNVDDLKDNVIHLLYKYIIY